MITKQQFVRDQGFPDGDAGLYEPLMFQPRAVGVIVAAAVITQQPWVFVALGVILLWSAFVPAGNPFDLIYNAAIARRLALARLGATPAPRRFSMGMGGAVALATAVSMAADLTYAARGLQAFFAVALVSVVFFRLCGPAKLYGRFSSRERHDVHDARSRPART